MTNLSYLQRRAAHYSHDTPEPRPTACHNFYGHIQLLLHHNQYMENQMGLPEFPAFSLSLQPIQPKFYLMHSSDIRNSHDGMAGSAWHLVPGTRNRSPCMFSLAKPYADTTCITSRFPDNLKYLARMSKNECPILGFVSKQDFQNYSWAAEVLWSSIMESNVLPLQSSCPLRMRLTVGCEMPSSVAMRGSLHPVFALIACKRLVMFEFITLILYGNG